MCTASSVIRMSNSTWISALIGTGLAIAFAIYYKGLLNPYIDRLQRRRGVKTLFQHNSVVSATFYLKDRLWLTYDTCLLVFAFPEGIEQLGLPLGNHIMLSDVIKVDDSTTKRVARPYTPVSKPGEHLQIIVKVYRPLLPNFPAGGIMSQHLADIPLPHEFTIRGPLGRLQYVSRGCVQIKRGGASAPIFEKVNIKRLAMIAGGSGITPMYQLLQSILDDVHDQTKINLKLLYSLYYERLRKNP
ncbi:hypothetical protein ACOME3_006960 [Neoechinorhynchus agilis]